MKTRDGETGRKRAKKEDESRSHRSENKESLIVDVARTKVPGSTMAARTA